MEHKKDWMKSPLELPELPYAKDALAPVISEQTIEYHYGKHHKAYFDTTKDLVKGTDLEGASLEEIVDVSAKNPDLKKLYNNSAQAWNHNLYWKQFAPVGQSRIPVELEELLTQTFGSVEDSRKRWWMQASTALEAAGHGWLLITANWTSTRPPTAITLGKMANPLSSDWMSGSMLTTWIIRTFAKSTSKKFWIRLSIGTTFWN